LLNYFFQGEKLKHSPTLFAINLKMTNKIMIIIENGKKFLLFKWNRN